MQLQCVAAYPCKNLLQGLSLDLVPLPLLSICIASYVFELLVPTRSTRYSKHSLSSLDFTVSSVRSILHLTVQKASGAVGLGLTRRPNLRPCAYVINTCHMRTHDRV